MTNKSWHFARRTFLQGVGLSLGLPLLESMADDGVVAKTAQPRRLCCVYFPFGVSLPPAKHEHAQWNWFPQGEGREYKVTNTLKPLESLRKEITVLGGLSHPQCRKLGGHDTGDTFLTGAALKEPDFANTISLDQYAAAHVGEATRYPSMVLSSDGGVGEPTRSTTLSFTRQGRPIPALAKPQQVFDRLFGVAQVGVRERLQDTGSMLDLLLEHAKSVRGRLGRLDQRKFDDYLDSVRAVEQRVQRSQKWLDTPRPKIDAGDLKLDVDQKAPLEYIRTIYDLIFLAFQTDTTRVATYMLGQVAGATTIANAFPACIGLTPNWHGLAHGAGKKGGFERLGRFDQFLVDQLAYFLKRLKNTPEGEGSLLDNTLVFYGSSNSKTHNNNNYPLLLAGGRNLGIKHGQYLRFNDRTPLANLFVTMLDRLQVPVKAFADSAGEMSEVT